ncbi:hypothetical protein C8R44DRAFT_804463 [Mycena epipterygia]|nr:hypothetical protein C8R44DRAFT_804463 [Mycena epipterygia]
MPPQPTVTRFNNILKSLDAAITTVEAVSNGLETPFLRPISTTIRSLLTSVQTVKKNKEDCKQMLEKIHELLYAIIRLHIDSDTGGQLLPSMLENLGKFTETLHKIDTFVEAQGDKSIIKRFFRQGEMSTLLKDCHVGLEQALKVFKTQGINVWRDLTEMQQYAQQTHQEVLDLISALSDGTSSDRGSSVSEVLSTAQNSSNSLSLLPSEPKIFYGRESEVLAILQTFIGQTPRIAILGAGGMGKTSLARAVLHHLEITAKYGQHRIFVACDTASSSLQLAVLIGAHVGLKPGKDLPQRLIHQFSSGPPSLLILDNLETVWEPLETRTEVERFLALLADLDNLALIITLRGAERPANIKWTRPFMEPLKPLRLDAARQTFIDIVDDIHADEDIDKILRLADNMPLAIDLLAHLVDCEGLASVLERWETERTSLISEGHDRRSNLDLSISLSLHGPRLDSLPHSRDLLSLLSMLPDGLTDVELLQSRLPLDNILACKATLLAASLAYVDDQKRLKTLVPIREYMQKMHPPMAHLVQPLLSHYQQLLEIHDKYFGTVSSAALVARITANFSNIQNVLLQGLNLNNADLINTIYCTCYFHRFSTLAGHGDIPLINNIKNVLPSPKDHRLEVFFIVQLLNPWRHYPVPNAYHLVQQATEYFTYFNDTDLKCRFYDTVAQYWRSHHRDLPEAIHFTQAGISFATSTGNTKRLSELLVTLASLKYQVGDYTAGRVDAYESQRLAKISADLYGEVQALRIESICCSALGSYSAGMSISTRARQLLGRCGMTGGSLDHTIMIYQAEFHRSKSEYVEALHIHKHILEDVSIEQDAYEHALALLNIAQIDVEIGAAKEDVQKKIDKAKSVFKDLKFPVAMMYCDATQAALHMREGNLFSAKAVLQQCITMSWGKDRDLVGYCLDRLGDVCQWGTNYSAPATWTVTFLVNGLKEKQKLETHKALKFLGDVYMAEGDHNTALSLFTVALEGFTTMDVHRSRAECMLCLGDIASLQVDSARAAQLWATARPLFEKSSQAKQVAQVDERLAGVCIPDQLIQLSDLDACITPPEELSNRMDMMVEDTTAVPVPA